MTKAIYGLRDHEDVIRYVGQTGEVVSRLEYHIAKAFRVRADSRTPVQQWIWDQIVVHHHVPGVDVLEFVEDDEVFAAEKRWIESFDPAQITNVPHAVRMGPAFREAQRKANTGRKPSEATRQKMRESAKRAWEKRRGSTG